MTKEVRSAVIYKYLSICYWLIKNNNGFVQRTQQTIQFKYNLKIARTRQLGTIQFKYNV